MEPLILPLCVATVDSVCTEMVDLADELASQLSSERASLQEKGSAEVVVRPHRSMNGVYPVFTFHFNFVCFCALFFLNHAQLRDNDAACGNRGQPVAQSNPLRKAQTVVHTPLHKERRI
jgi:hypothetical protein